MPKCELNKVYTTKYVKLSGGKSMRFQPYTNNYINWVRWPTTEESMLIIYPVPNGQA